MGWTVEHGISSSLKNKRKLPRPGHFLKSEFSNWWLRMSWASFFTWHLSVYLLLVSCDYHFSSWNESKNSNIRFLLLHWQDVWLFQRFWIFLGKWPTLEDCVVAKTFHLDGLIGYLKGDIHVHTFLILRSSVVTEERFYKHCLVSWVPKSRCFSSSFVLYGLTKGHAYLVIISLSQKSL